MATHAFCSGCMQVQPIDAHWRAMWIDPDGDLRITEPAKGCDLDYERPDTVFACGEGSALRLTERYLHHQSFRIAHVLELEMAEIVRRGPEPSSLQENL